MAYSDADILNIYKGYTYGIPADEVKIQQMSSADQTRLARLAEADWSAENSKQSADAIDKLSNMGIPFSAALHRSVNAYNERFNNNEFNKSYVSPLSDIEDSAPLSITTDNSKLSVGMEAGTDVPATDIVVNQNAISSAFSSSSLLDLSSSQPLTASYNMSVEPTLIPQPKNDRRARLSPRAAVFDQLISANGIMKPLGETYGMMFPTTPTISETMEVNYDSYDMTHGLMPIQAYKSGAAKVLTVTGTFFAQTDVEARYCLACIHFLRSFSKMNFGENDPNAGTPPPILIFNAYGDAAFHNLPVIISQASLDWPNDVDYINTSSNVAASSSSLQYQTNSSAQSSMSARSTDTMIADGWVPSKFTISVTLTVQNTPSRLRKFNLQAFRNGNLLTGNGGWI